jgi:hypothetical protein
MPNDGNKYELVDGEIRVSPGAGSRHGFVVAVVYRSLSEVRPLGPEDSLEGEDVRPGFRCSLRSILE